MHVFINYQQKNIYDLPFFTTFIYFEHCFELIAFALNLNETSTYKSQLIIMILGFGQPHQKNQEQKSQIKPLICST